MREDIAIALASPNNSTTDLVNDSASSPPRIVMNSTQQPSPCCTSKLIPSGTPMLRIQSAGWPELPNPLLDETDVPSPLCQRT